MAYLALYRTWRPGTFNEVVGQEQTVTALKNAVRQGKTTHAYLFAGPRGTGKTSMAKILAKGVNCSDLREGEPCNACISCADINNGSFMDVVEIDAASNRGIDEIRDLREKIRIAPAQGKTKVYIIDEVHMLTTEAFNALLKTLEDPPRGVIFILATTESHKIPATIMSRCQIYSFRKLSRQEISKRLQEIAVQSDIELEEEANALIAHRADGGMRDALSILDQIHSYKGSPIRRQDVMDVLGIIDSLFVADLVDKLLNREIGAIITMMDQVLTQGKEIGILARESAYYLRDLLMLKLVGPDQVISGTTGNDRNRLQEQAKRLSQDQILQALKILMDVGEKIRFAESQRFLLEMAFMEVARVWSPRQPREEGISKSQAETPPDRKKPAPTRTGKDAQPTPEQNQWWGKVLARVKEIKIPTHALLSQGQFIGLKDRDLYIGYKKGYRFHKEKMEEKANKELVIQVIEEILGKKVEINFIFLDQDQYNDIIVQKAIELFGADMVEVRD